MFVTFQSSKENLQSCRKWRSRSEVKLWPTLNDKHKLLGINNLLEDGAFIKIHEEKVVGILI